MLQIREKIPLFLRRGIRRGVRTIVREKGYGTAIGAIFGVLFLSQILLLLLFGMQGGLQMLQEQTDLRLEILATATDAQIQNLFQSVKQLPSVADAVYITREQAYERARVHDPDLVAFLGKFGIENPFPETLGVRLKRLDDYPAFIQFLKKPEFSTVVNPAFLSQTTDQEQQVYQLIDGIRAGRSVLLALVALPIVVILFTVMELVRKRALHKREELLVEELVGASRRTMFIPFCTEMTCLLGAALLLSLLFTLMLVLLLPLLLPVLKITGLFGPWSAVSVALLKGSLLWLLPLEFVIVVSLGAVGTVLALKPQMSAQLLPLLKLQ